MWSVGHATTTAAAAATTCIATAAFSAAFVSTSAVTPAAITPSAVTSSADSPPCHVGKWVHLNRLGAWVVRGEPAALTKDAAEEVSKRPDAPKAHSAAAYCAARPLLCFLP